MTKKIGHNPMCNNVICEWSLSQILALFDEPNILTFYIGNPPLKT
jgi:hypothetical protein